MSEPVNADEIRENIKASLLQLLLLQEQGRIVMSEDRFNTDWPDSTAALTEAIGALRQAVAATAWMETLPHPDGGYPPLET